METKPSLAEAPRQACESATTAAAARPFAQTQPALRARLFPGTAAAEGPRVPGALAAIGETLPDGGPIGAGTIERLEEAARWGLGAILDVSERPGTGELAVGSSRYVALYDPETFGDPRLIALPEPFRYKAFFFSADGGRLKLEGWEETRVLDLETGELAGEKPGTEWVVPEFQVESDYGGLEVLSPDGSMKLRGVREYFEGYEHGMFTEETARVEVLDATTGALIATLAGNPEYLSYGQLHAPEGCDLSVFSLCGNALMDVVMAPYRAAFSPDGKIISVLYRLPSYGNPERASWLRSYDASTGRLHRQVGGWQHPVADFAYTADGRLWVGFIDGSASLWEAQSGEMLFSDWRFARPVDVLAYSASGRFLLIQRGDRVEVRESRSGSLVSRYEAATFAVSPSADQVALGDEEGRITVYDLASGRRLSTLEAHEGRILSLAYSEDGAALASSGSDCAIAMWDWQRGEYLHAFANNVGHPSGFSEDVESRVFVYATYFVPGTDQLVGFGSYGTVANWDVDSGETNYFVESEPLDTYYGMPTIKPHYPEFFAVNPATGQFIVDGLAFDLETGEPLAPVALPDELPEGCAAGGPLTLDGRLQITRGIDEREGSLCVLDATSHELIRTLEVIPPEAYGQDYVEWFYLRPDGSQLIVTTYSGVVYVFQISPE
jgi:WD40 repeat protein